MSGPHRHCRAGHGPSGRAQLGPLKFKEQARPLGPEPPDQVRWLDQAQDAEALWLRDQIQGPRAGQFIF